MFLQCPYGFIDIVKCSDGALISFCWFCYYLCNDLVCFVNNPFSLWYRVSDSSTKLSCCWWWCIFDGCRGLLHASNFLCERTVGRCWSFRSIWRTKIENVAGKRCLRRHIHHEILRTRPTSKIDKNPPPTDTGTKHIARRIFLITWNTDRQTHLLAISSSYKIKVINKLHLAQKLITRSVYFN